MRNLKEVLNWAQDHKVAVGHFNISDSEGFRAVVDAAKSLRVPVIIGVSEGERGFIGLEEVVALVRSEREEGTEVFLNADHSYSFESLKAAVDADFDAVIIDGAKLSLEENIALTKSCVEYAHTSGKQVLVEGEVGYIGQSSKVLSAMPDDVSLENLTTPEEAKRFVEETGVDLFAPAVGNIHGILRSGNPKLNIERIREIREAVGVPLVLHGGSGISDDDFRKSIDAGIRIVHINTELRLAYKEGIKEGLSSDEIAPYKFLAKGVEEMREVVENKLKVFNKIS